MHNTVWTFRDDRTVYMYMFMVLYTSLCAYFNFFYNFPVSWQSIHVQNRTAFCFVFPQKQVFLCKIATIHRPIYDFNKKCLHTWSELKKKKNEIHFSIRTKFTGRRDLLCHPPSVFSREYLHKKESELKRANERWSVIQKVFSSWGGRRGWKKWEDRVGKRSTTRVAFLGQWPSLMWASH